MSKLTKMITRWKTAFQAGWIANRCPNCVVDNELEEIRACDIHEDEIARLAVINEDASK